MPLSLTIVDGSAAGVSAIALEAEPFTADQARSGAALYAANCAGCHGARLQGAGEAPPNLIELVRDYFGLHEKTWGKDAFCGDYPFIARPSDRSTE